MDITIHSTFLPHDDPDATLVFYRDTLGFEVRYDVEYGGCIGSRSAPASSHTGFATAPSATPRAT